MQTYLSGPQWASYNRIFQRPIPHDLQWQDLWSLLGAIRGVDAIEDENGNRTVSRNGQTLAIHHPRGKDLANRRELMRVRNFLERSAIPAAMQPEANGTHLLVVIDHREARIYSAEMRASVPVRVTRYDPFEFGRDLRYQQDDSNGQREPGRRSFFDAVIKTLQGAQQIVMFGTGIAPGNEMKGLLNELKCHHPDVAERVVDSIAVDEQCLTESQLLANARELFVIT